MLLMMIVETDRRGEYGKINGMKNGTRHYGVLFVLRELVRPIELPYIRLAALNEANRNRWLSCPSASRETLSLSSAYYSDLV